MTKIGFANHTPYFPALLQRCSYYGSMTRDRPHPVDAAWLYSQVYPAFYQTQPGREQRLENLTGALVLRGYISSALFFSLAGSLSFEDDRVTSSRLAVLKALYLQSGAGFPATAPLNSAKRRGNHVVSSPRTHILVALESSAHARLTRCQESSALSVASEVDTNYISKRGFLDGDGGVDRALMQTALLTGCTIGALAKGSEERPAYKTRDNDNGSLELLKFVIATHLAETSGAVHSRSGDGESCAGSAALLHSAVRVFVCMFRCYGFKLGNSSELVEQADLLASLTETLQGLLLWAHALSIWAHQLRGGGSPSQRVHSEPVLNSVCRVLLSAVQRHWTARCNFAQDIAFIRAAEILLATFSPLSAQQAETAPDTPAGALPNLLGGVSVLQCVARRCLLKVLDKVSCAHFKVALQALQSAQNLSVQFKYILPCFRPPRYLPFAQQLSETVPATGVLRPGKYHVGFPAALRESMLNVLVEALRANRAHWHPVVQQTSGTVLDALFDRIQDLEDEEDDRRDRGEELPESGDEEQQEQWSHELETDCSRAADHQPQLSSSSDEEEGNYV